MTAHQAPSDIYYTYCCRRTLRAICLLSPLLVQGKSTLFGIRRADRRTATALNNRKHARYPVEYAVSLSGKSLTATGLILNLSVTGCRIRTEGTIDRGELLRLLIDVPRHKPPLHVELAMVRWSNGYEFGMEFLGVPVDDQKRLRELIRATEAATDLRRGKKH